VHPERNYKLPSAAAFFQFQEMEGRMGPVGPLNTAINHVEIEKKRAISSKRGGFLREIGDF
jgi:hypothetical protein